MTVAPKPQGSLAATDLPELVHRLYQGRWTGTVTLTHAGVGKSIKVQDGQMVFASSTCVDERLGQLLLRRGRITLRQFTHAGQSVVPGRRLGAILVEQGVLEPKELIEAVVAQTREIIYGAFQWVEGQYRLQEGEIGAEDITLRISTPDLIMEGIRRIEAWSRIARGVGGLETRYRRRQDYERVVALMDLSTEQLALVTGLHGTQDVETLCREVPLGDFELCQALWAFRVINVVERVDKPSEKPASPVDEGLSFILSEE